jgi:pteridine reductase
MRETKVALVTGAGKKRVGYHVAKALAARAYALAIHYRSSATEAAETAAEFARSGSAPVVTVCADLVNEAEVKGMITEVLARFGRIDVLVNCAAIWNRKRLEDVTAADVRQHFEANTLGTFLTCQHVGLAMVKQPDGGCIVNLGDWAEARPYRDYAAYFPSKSAILGLTRTFAVELGTRNPNVRVNAILPGPVMLTPDLPAAERAASIAATLAQREGSPDHVAKAVMHFIDNDYITGTCLPVDGGRTVFAGGN